MAWMMERRTAMFNLKSGKLCVEITEPGEKPNTGFRFDRAAFVSEVIYDGMRFCASEPQNLSHPCSGGRGFCSEYRFDTSADAKVGEYFPKFGVGLIKKEADEPYIFHKAYKDVKDFPVKISHDENSAVFTTEAVPCLGYAMRAEKKLMISDDTMTLTTIVENVGEKEIIMEEFCHNFISIDGMAVGSDYELAMPLIPDQGNERLKNRRGYGGVLRGNGSGFTFCEFIAVDTDICVEGGDIRPEIPFTWKMTHKGARASVECSDYFVPKKVPVWGVDHMFCPEVVHGFSLKPGESHEWKRVWKFSRY